MDYRHLSYPNVEFQDVPIYMGRPAFRFNEALGNPHLHSHYEIFWFAEGKAQFFHDFNHYELQPQTLAFVAPGQIHHLYGDWAQIDLIVLGFSHQIFTLGNADSSLLFDLPFFEPHATPHLQPTAVYQDAIHNLFVTMWHRIYPMLSLPLNDRPHELLFAYLKTALLELEAAYTAVYPTSRQSTGNNLIKQFHQAVEAHYLKRKTVNEYAELLGVTPNHLVRSVRESTGRPPAQFARERLLLEAKRQLINGDLPLSDLAEKLAFHSASQFGHWFRKMANGTSPKQFRQKRTTLLDI